MPAPQPDDPLVAARLQDRMRLRADWDMLRSQNPHLHAPQAAAMLGVPEAALTACRIGSGAIRLAPDPAALLAPATGWRRVLLAHGSAAGVSLAIGRLDSVAASGGRIRLEGAHVVTDIAAGAVAHAFWFIDQDAMHGRTRSLQLFDRAGRDVLKLLVLHRAAAAEAEAHLARFRLPDDLEAGPFDPEADTPPGPAAGAWAGPARLLPGAPGALLRRALEALPAFGEPVAIISFSATGAQTLRGRVAHVRQDAAMVHVHEQDIRMHLRPQAMQSAALFEGESGRAGLVFHAASGPALALSPVAHEEAFVAWAGGLLPAETA